MTATSERSVRLPAVALVLLGAVLVIVSFGFLNWYDVPSRGADTAGEVTFAQLRSSARQLDGARTASAYFGWLGWLLVVLLIVAGVAASLPFGPADGFRVAGFLLGLVGVAVTYLAVVQLHNAQVAAGAAEHSVFYNSTWGMWAVFLGFACGAVGAALGPRSGAG
ncbi:MAG TPA: hypothetical protein VE442_16595 [Jatrophihabitans sp.]|nr:hypothetical protein [Jatrophihabitans sp.]